MNNDFVEVDELILEIADYKNDYADMDTKGRGRGKGVAFYISPTGSVERKALLDALKDLV